MKKLLVYLLITSIGINLYYLKKKFQHLHQSDEVKKLLLYKKIPYEKGTDTFFEGLKKTYPESQFSHKNIVVYRWDSLHYDFIYRDQLRALDSMATHFQNHQLEFVLVTEMEEEASKQFLTRNGENYRNLKMLFGMDDFISGLHNIKGLKLKKTIVKTKHRLNETDSSIFCMKQPSFYAIIDSGKKVLYTNEGKWTMLVKDTAFLNKLKQSTKDNYNPFLN